MKNVLDHLLSDWIYVKVTVGHTPLSISYEDAWDTEV